jgi:hypothetical protein
VASATLYNLSGAGVDSPADAAMTEPLAPTTEISDALHAEAVDGVPARSNVATALRSRVVREARRETWFVVNEGHEDIATIPVGLRGDASLRRVDVNGEVAEFSASEHEVLVRPRRALRAGAGTIVVLHFR